LRKRVVYISATLLLAVLVALVVWQSSFSFGEFGPSSPEQTYTVWAVSTLIFILTVTLGFMLVRNFVKLYVDHRRNREGSRIRTKLVLGALALTITPVVFLVFFSIGVLNINLRRWFTQPAENIRLNFIEIGAAIERENRSKAEALAMWIAQSSEIAQARQNLHVDLKNTCQQRGIAELRLEPADGAVMWLCGPAPPEKRSHVEVRYGDLILRTAPVLDLAQIQHEITDAVRRYHQLAAEGQAIKRSYLQLLVLITLFILFFATWLALFLAKQISVPITALLAAAQEIRKGNLGTKVEVGAADELASLVRAFNEMSLDLEANSRELENRRRFTEAILESIPTGVISLTSDGRVQRVNRALRGLLGVDLVNRASRLEDLFISEDAAEIRYLMNRARRMSVAASQIEIRDDQRVLHLSVTVSALDERVTSGFVIVLEDTTDMLRAQKAAAWHEIARRIAHEIKNPLTPISLCAERISRQLDRIGSPEKDRILRECSNIIASEVQSVKTLVDEFSHFARLPAAQPSPADLNDVVENAMAVFAGRLDDIEVRKDLSPGLPQVNIDREQFKRVVVNLIDNAAEAMRDSLVKQLYVGTAAIGGDFVELIIADTGCGISHEDKEKLFLPYFTRNPRGTGLGLAIVNHIVSEHGAQIRVENNHPKGARFVIEVGAMVPDTQPIEASA
jgi:two-component system, NtrC family, nitrogen regulation sensor histidine kinase NtrY